MIDVTDQNRLFVCNELAKGTDPDAIADALVHQLALDYVESVAQRESSRRAAQQVVRRFHVFAVPAKNATPLLARFDQFRVQEADRAAFAAKYNVPEHDLLRVASGELPSAGVVRQGTVFGTLDTSRVRLLAEAEKANRKSGNRSSMPATPLDGPISGALPTKHTERPSAPVFNMVQDFHA